MQCCLACSTYTLLHWEAAQPHTLAPAQSGCQKKKGGWGGLPCLTAQQTLHVLHLQNPELCAGTLRPRSTQACRGGGGSGAAVTSPPPTSSQKMLRTSIGSTG